MLHIGESDENDTSVPPVAEVKAPLLGHFWVLMTMLRNLADTLSLKPCGPMLWYMFTHPIKQSFEVLFLHMGAY